MSEVSHAVSGVSYARLRVVQPDRWRAAAAAWRDLAEWAGRRSADIAPQAGHLRTAWPGAAGSAAQRRLAAVRRRLARARLGCWQADQAFCELAADVARARAVLAAAVRTADGAGLTITADGRITTTGTPGPGAVAVARDTTAALATALATATRADATAAARLVGTAAALTAPTSDATAPPGSPATPACGASPAEVRRWWDALSPAQRDGLVLDEPAVVGALDGVPAAIRDLANRLLLDDHREAVDARVTGAHGAELRRLRDLQGALHALAARLADDSGARPYLLRLDPGGEGRAVVALGDPDRADNVLTHVPGMTAGLASLDGELDRAARVAERARQVAPQEATSAVLWLDYDAPDSLPEAAGAGRAEAGAVSLRRFQDGLRAAHDGPAAHLTVAGHSYGSLVVGAGARAGLTADSVVFVGSPGVGVDTVTDLRVPAGQVWSTTSVSDIVQYAAVAPGGLFTDLVSAAAIPVLGPALAFGLPEDDLWHGHNPSDPGFGARVFTAQQDAGHLGYWDPGRPALDSLAHITLGGAYQEQVR